MVVQMGLELATVGSQAKFQQTAAPGVQCGPRTHDPEICEPLADSDSSFSTFYADYFSVNCHKIYTFS